MITAKLSHLRISPRKVRLVANLIKGLTAEEAERQLSFLNKRAARPILKLLKSAVANAQSSANADKKNLYIAKINVEGGPVLKRWRPRAMGRATPIMKRTSHISLSLDQKETDAQKDKKAITEKKSAEEIKTTSQKEKLPSEKKIKLEKIDQLEKEKESTAKPKPVTPARPYPTTSRSKKKFFSRQTFGNAKKLFRRKSL